MCLKIDKHQRISEAVKFGLVLRSCEVSYAKSGEAVGVTAQTTSNVLKELREEELKQYPIPEQKHRAENIFVCADEDHIAIREKGNQQQYMGTSALIRCVERREIFSPDKTKNAGNTRSGISEAFCKVWRKNIR